MWEGKKFLISVYIKRIKPKLKAFKRKKLNQKFKI